MTERQPEDELAEFAAELKLLAEAVLERVEPVLRRSAATGRTDWESCSWCPVCAAAALIRGERHDVLAAIADHGTAIVTVLREALAGVPVDPVRFAPETGEPHRHAPTHPEDAAAQGDPGSSGAAQPAADAGGRGAARSGADESSPAAPGAGGPGTGAAERTRAEGADKRRFRRDGSGYVDIPVTVRR
ncbi:hypothetical protein [Nocardia asteroides]|uniref:hypothetical protein n=1 Tax=Nocardia asteroides TaxID=1824 RepID=UPI001E6057B6|nr:hypothetical protein [Nocardia asteroides]UGT60658.1 hypothetical protein LTT61_26365 [Nocardia asteroides]